MPDFARRGGGHRFSRLAIDVADVPPASSQPAVFQRKEAPGVSRDNGEKTAGFDFSRLSIHPLQRKSATVPPQTNHTGMPDRVKAGVENLSGVSLDDVKVHYSSPEPAKIQALAYAQGNEIHLGPGQEKHLPHEAWHVVQQRQGRVPAQAQIGPMAINYSPVLEREADVMGSRSIQSGQAAALARQAEDVTQRASPSGPGGTSVVQMEIGRGTIIALAIGAGVATIAAGLIAVYGTTYTWIWVNSKVRGVNLVQPIADLETLWNAVPALTIQEVLAMGQVHAGINAAGLIHIAQNVPGHRTLADLIQVANGVPALTAVQVAQVGAVHAGINPAGLIHLAQNVPGHRTLADLIQVANGAPLLTAIEVAQLAGIHAGINVAGMIHIGQNMPGGRTVPEIVQVGNDLPLLTAQQVVQLVAAHGGVATANLLSQAVTGDWTPVDNFNNRSTVQIGVGEHVNLTVNINPATITPANLGGLLWAVGAGNGLIAAPNAGAGTATFQSHGGAGALQVHALVQQAGGYLNAQVGVLNRTAVAPNGATMHREVITDQRTFALDGYARSGFRGRARFHPNDVSFNQVQIREQAVAGVGIGYFLPDNGSVHALGNWGGVGNGHSILGSPDLFSDTIETNQNYPPYAAGTFTWPIPWEYQAPGVGATPFTVCNHVEQMFANGRLAIWKAGSVKTWNF